MGEEKSPLKIAQTLYNKLYSRMDRARNKLPDELTEKDLTEEAFFEWSKKYSAAKEDFKNGKISGEQLLDIIKYD